MFSAEGELYQVPAGGGEPVALERASDGARPRSARWPVFLPDDRTFLYLGWNADGDREIMAASFDDPIGRPLFTNPVHVHYVRPGYLLFQNQTTLFAQPFDAETLSFTGDPVRVADDLWPSPVAGRGTFAASTSGTLAYRAGGAEAASADVVWSDRRGGTLATVGESNRYRQIALSPDGRQVAFSLSEAATGRLELWTLDLSTGVTSRLTYAETSTDDPIWRRDGAALAYFASLVGGTQVFEQALGSRTVSPMFAAPEEGRYPHDWSTDGRFLLFHRGNGLFVKPVGSEDPPRLLRQMRGSVDSGRFSPDGRWIAYGSNESGAWEVYVAPFPAFDRSRQVSTRGGVQPRWRGDGWELFYLEPDGRLMSVAVRQETSGAFEAAAPVPLFTSPLSQPIATIDQWAATRDGQRFLFIHLRSITGSAAPIRVIANWQPPVR